MLSNIISISFLWTCITMTFFVGFFSFLAIFSIFFIL